MLKSNIVVYDKTLIIINLSINFPLISFPLVESISVISVREANADYDRESNHE